MTLGDSLPLLGFLVNVFLLTLSPTLITDTLQHHITVERPLTCTAVLIPPLFVLITDAGRYPLVVSSVG